MKSRFPEVSEYGEAFVLLLRCPSYFDILTAEILSTGTQRSKDRYFSVQNRLRKQFGMFVVFHIIGLIKKFIFSSGSA